MSIVNRHEPATPAKPNTPPPKLRTWVSVYRLFNALTEAVTELPEGINQDSALAIARDLVDSLYAQHKAEMSWRVAYDRWNERMEDLWS